MYCHTDPNLKLIIVKLYPMNSIYYMLSPYSFMFEDNERFYIFNSESLFFSAIAKELYINLYERDFDKIDEETFKTLLGKRVVIPKEEKNTCYNHLLTKHLTSAYADDTMVLIIAPTTACNFACPYCFESKKNPKFITDEVEDKIIEYINKQEHIKNISLTWYGGEPLLAVDRIRSIYERIVSETDKKITSHEIISNTFLVNEEVLNMFRDINMEKIQVSIDGVRERHDKTRFVKASKAPTFEVIEANIEKMAKALPDLHISIRVNINKENWMDFVTLYHKYHGEPWHANIGLYPGFIREDRKDGCAWKHSCFQIEELTELHFKFAENGVNVNFFPSNRFKGCMLQRANAFIIGPEGELYKCWEDVGSSEKIVGSIMDNELHNYGLLMKYMQECRPIREECRECMVFPVCDGGCGRQQYRNKFEGGEFQLCSGLKDNNVLKKMLLYTTCPNNNSEREKLNL